MDHRVQRTTRCDNESRPRSVCSNVRPERSGPPSLQRHSRCDRQAEFHSLHSWDRNTPVRTDFSPGECPKASAGNAARKCAAVTARRETGPPAVEKVAARADHALCLLLRSCEKVREGLWQSVEQKSFSRKKYGPAFVLGNVCGGPEHTVR